MLEIKKNLAYAYRILAYLNMDDHTYTHLSARASAQNQYYIYPFGFRFSEVTPECLLKIDLEDGIIEGHEEEYNKTGYVIHGSIYKNRPDVKAIFHLHTPASVAVSAMKVGLLPISQWALHFYQKIAYHGYNSLVLENSHSEELVRDLKQHNIMLMRNHGMLLCGKTIMEAMFYAYHLEMACKTQCLALQSSQELIFPSEEICKKSVEDLLGFEENLGQRDWKAWLRVIGV